MTILDIICRPAFYFKHSIAETGFCLLLQLEPTQMVSIYHGHKPVDLLAPLLVFSLCALSHVSTTFTLFPAIY
jgi:hypothetical protein